MQAEREVALRLATNREVDRKLRIASRSRFFWVYALSLWDPDAFWSCITGAACFASFFLIIRVMLPGFIPMSLTATATFEYFLLGLVLMWLYSLGPWLHPTNLKVILTFIFRLYRRNKTAEDLSAEEIGRLFPPKRVYPAYTLIERVHPSRVYAKVTKSPALSSLVFGLVLTSSLVILLVASS